MEKIETFILRDGRTVDIVIPSMEGLKPITKFVNKLSKENTFLSFTGEEYSLAHEKNWLKNALNEIKFKKLYLIWAVIDGQIIGSCDLKKGGSRDGHVGTIGLMVDIDFRRQGLGKYLLGKILMQAKELGYKAVQLGVFDDNVAAKNLYTTMGFVECGRIPDGLYRKGNYSDNVTMYQKIQGV